MPLTDLACRSAKPTDKLYKLSDAGGLQLWVTPKGLRTWRMAYRFDGAQKTLTIGAYPEIKLSDAREARDAAKKALKADIDPAKVSKDAEAEEVVNSFKVVAEEWLENDSERWSPSHKEAIEERLKNDVYPSIGHLDVGKIEPPEVLTMLRKIESRGALYSTKRIKQNTSGVFRFAVATGRAKRDPTQDLKGALKVPPKVAHNPSLSERQLPEFLKKLDAYDGHLLTRLAINLTLLTMTRTSEVRFSGWPEFDLEVAEPLWRIPGPRMKMRLEHIVPLSKQALAIVRQIKQLSGTASFLFPAPGKKGVMSENTMLFALYRMGYHSRLTIHGLRGTASTILNEAGWNRDWIERQLAHDDPDQVRGAYNAAQYLDGRRTMLQAWADLIDTKRA